MKIWQLLENFEDKEEFNESKEHFEDKAEESFGYFEKFLKVLLGFVVGEKIFSISFSSCSLFSAGCRDRCTPSYACRFVAGRTIVRNSRTQSIRSDGSPKCGETFRQSPRFQWLCNKINNIISVSARGAIIGTLTGPSMPFHHNSNRVTLR